MRRRAEAIPPALRGLWPAPAELSLQEFDDPGAVAYLAVPSARSPRILVPDGFPAASSMLKRYGGGPATRAVRSVWHTAVSTPSLHRLPLPRVYVREDPNGIESHLAQKLQRDLRMGVLLGPRRPNAKPVLQLFDGLGETVAFAKVGVNPLVAELVNREARALRLVASQPRRTFSAPEVLAFDTWRDMPVLIQRALPHEATRQSGSKPPVSVMAEIAGLCGFTHQAISPDLLGGPLSPGANWFGIDLSNVELLRGRLSAEVACPLGSWHGDFGPWNMAVNGSTTLVWDWERFERGMPVGSDAAHHRTQRAVAKLDNPSSAWRLITHDVEEVLTACGQDIRHARVVAGTYLVAICRRYVRDAVDGPAPALRRRMTWLAELSAVAAAALERRIE